MGSSLLFGHKNRQIDKSGHRIEGRQTSLCSSDWDYLHKMLSPAEGCASCFGHADKQD